ncbi:MAG: hypothetical protein AAF487_00495 [Bacteroidota bacterium]
MSNKQKISLKDPEYIIALGVTIISLCALVVSVQQTRIMKEERELMREYSRASVWPRLEFGLSKGHGEDGRINKFAFTLSNSGVGPAIITDVKVMYNGEIASDWWNLFEMQEIPDSIETYITNESFNDRIIKIGELREVLNLDNNPDLANALYYSMQGVTIDIYYESIYGEKWKYAIGENDVETIEVPDFQGLTEEEQFNS